MPKGPASLGSRSARVASVSTLERSLGAKTHEVTNQPPPLVDYNVFEADRALAAMAPAGGPRAAFLCFSEAEAGIGCPLSATYSVIAALRHQPPGHP